MRWVWLVLWGCGLFNWWVWLVSPAAAWVWILWWCIWGAESDSRRMEKWVKRTVIPELQVHYSGGRLVDYIGQCSCLYIICKQHDHRLRYWYARRVLYGAANSFPCRAEQMLFPQTHKTYIATIFTLPLSLSLRNRESVSDDRDLCPWPLPLHPRPMNYSYNYTVYTLWTHFYCLVIVLFAPFLVYVMNTWSKFPTIIFIITTFQNYILGHSCDIY